MDFATAKDQVFIQTDLEVQLRSALLAAQMLNDDMLVYIIKLALEQMKLSQVATDT